MGCEKDLTAFIKFIGNCDSLQSKSLREMRTRVRSFVPETPPDKECALANSCLILLKLPFKKA